MGGVIKQVDERQRPEHNGDERVRMVSTKQLVLNRLEQEGRKDLLER